MGRGYGAGRIIGKLSDGRYQGLWTDAHGKRRKGALATTKAESLQMLREIVVLRDRTLAGIHTETLDCLWSEGLRSYLSDLKHRATAAHYLSVLNSLERFQAHSKAVRMSQVTRDSARAWRDSLIGEGLSARTVNKHVGALQTFTRFLDDERKADDRLKGLKKLKESSATKKRPTRALTDQEVQKLLSVLTGRERAVVQFLVNTGLRWGELARVQEADVSLEGVRVAPETKTGEGRFVPFGELNAGALDALDFIHSSGRRNLFGVGSCSSNFLSRVLNPALKAAGIEKVGTDGKVIHLHSLRHTFATKLVKSGVPMMVAQKLMGHKSIKMLAEVYAHIGDSDLSEHLNSPSLGGAH